MKLTVKDLRKLIQDVELSPPDNKDKRLLADHYLSNIASGSSSNAPIVEPTYSVDELATMLKLSAAALQILKDEKFITVEDVRILAEADNFPDNLTMKQADKLKLAKFLRPDTPASRLQIPTRNELLICVPCLITDPVRKNTKTRMMRTAYVSKRALRATSITWIGTTIKI